MLSGEGIPSVENQKVSWFLGFEVSWFLGLLFVWPIGLLVSKFQRFTKPFNVWKISLSYYQISTPCFLEGIDFIFKIFKKVKTDLQDLSAFVVSRVFEK